MFVEFEIPNTTGLDEFLGARDVTVRYTGELKETARVSFKKHCKHLRRITNPRDSTKWAWECTVHGTIDKPEVCKIAPTRPEDLLPGCGYSFKEE